MPNDDLEKIYTEKRMVRAVLIGRAIAISEFNNSPAEFALARLRLAVSEYQAEMARLDLEKDALLGTLKAAAE